MTTMRGATLVAPYEIRLDDMPRPEVDGDDIVILQNAGIGICGSNLHWWYGGGPATGLMSFPMPGAGGHEYAGVVAEVGRAVTAVRPGDRVTVDQFESTCCGTCAYCSTGLFTQCQRRRVMGAAEGFVEYLKLTEKGLYRVPDGIETHLASVVQPVACSVSAVRRVGLRGGESVVVLGGGVLGVCAAAAAKALGAGLVIVTAKHPQQQAMARRFGADLVVPSNDPELVARIVAACGGVGADLVVETVGGAAPTLALAADLVRPAGTIAVLGLWDDYVPVDSWKSVLKEISYRFFLNHGVVGRRADYQLCLDWMAAGILPAQELVSHVVSLEEIAEGFRLANDKTSGVVKVVVRP